MNRKQISDKLATFTDDEQKIAYLLRLVEETAKPTRTTTPKKSTGHRSKKIQRDRLFWDVEPGDKVEMSPKDISRLQEGVRYTKPVALKCASCAHSPLTPVHIQGGEVLYCPSCHLIERINRCPQCSRPIHGNTCYVDHEKELLDSAFDELDNMFPEEEVAHIIKRIREGITTRYIIALLEAHSLHL